MMRAIISAFIGYVVMAVCVMAGIAAIWYSLGNEFAFSGDTNLASTGWSILVLSCGLAGAVAGGCVAAMIGGPKGRLAVRVLMSLVIIFGCMTLMTQLNAQAVSLPQGVSIRDLDFVEAGDYAVSPMWFNFAIVVVGGMGAWLGGRLCLPQRAKR